MPISEAEKTRLRLGIFPSVADKIREAVKNTLQPSREGDRCPDGVEELIRERLVSQGLIMMTGPTKGRPTPQGVGGGGVALHAATHLVGAGDPLTVGIPSNIGIANAAGILTDFVRRDHIHAHPVFGAGVLANPHDHSDIAGVTANQHHARDHQATHLAAGADPFIHGAAEHTNVSRYMFIPVDLQSGTERDTDFGHYYMSDNISRRHASKFRLPSDFVSIITFNHVFNIAGGAGAANMYYQRRLSGTAIGETHPTVNNLSAFAALAVTMNQLQLDSDWVADGLFAGIDANDYIGVASYRDATDVLDTINAITDHFGWIMVYTAEQ